MALLFGKRKYQANPVTRVLIVLGILTGWFCFSNVRTLFTVSDSMTDISLKSQHLVIKGRTLLAQHGMAAKDETFNNMTKEKEGKGEMLSESNDTIVIDCIVPAVTQFPNPLMDNDARIHGGILVHIFLASYMFIGLAIVCDDYFVPSLNRVSDVMNLSPDVAGATFMAAGSSAPELATSVIGVFVAKDDIGVTGVIGSAVFNITLVIAVCALAAEHAFVLNWYSVCRDCFCYLICIIALLIVIGNDIVSWPESLAFLLLYVIYCVFMAFNSSIENYCADKLPVPQSWRTAQADSGTEKDVETEQNDESSKIEQEQKKLMEEDLIENPLKKPLKLDVGLWKVICWYVMFPLKALAVFTIPDCRRHKWSRWFVVSFLVSIAWISLYSYFMVWMITIIGFTLGVPDNVMGLTFIAAGVSVPDALSGIAVVKEGHGDMAVSNAIGSNVFDILVCLGLPWFIKTAIQQPGSIVQVKSKGVIYSTVTLFSTVVGLVVISHMNGWKLDRKYGFILIVWYAIVMIFATLYETNLLGPFVLPECKLNNTNF